MNRIIEFVEELNSSNIRDWDNILKESNKKFSASFRFNRTEADYLTKYYKGQLNFNAKIINHNFKKQERCKNIQHNG